MTQPKIQPIYKGGLPNTENRGPKELIQTEWKIIDKLQTLASHIRTLSMLLKNHGQPNNNQDLAKLLTARSSYVGSVSLVSSNWIIRLCVEGFESHTSEGLHAFI